MLYKTVMYSFYLSLGHSRATPVWVPSRAEQLEVNLDYYKPAFDILLLLGEYFQVYGYYLNTSRDAQENKQDRHGLYGQLVMILS